jgi:hypothetical protein
MQNNIVTDPANALSLIATPFGVYLSCVNHETELAIESGVSNNWRIVYLTTYCLSGGLLSYLIIWFIHLPFSAIFLASMTLLLINYLSPTASATGAGNKVLNALRNNIALQLDTVSQQSHFRQNAHPSAHLLIIFASFFFAMTETPSIYAVPLEIGALLCILLIVMKRDKPFQIFLSRKPSKEELLEAIEVGKEIYSQTARIEQMQKYQ